MALLACCHVSRVAHISDVTQVRTLQPEQTGRRSSSELRDLLVARDITGLRL